MPNEVNIQDPITGMKARVTGGALDVNATVSVSSIYIKDASIATSVINTAAIPTSIINAGSIGAASSVYIKDAYVATSILNPGAIGSASSVFVTNLNEETLAVSVLNPSAAASSVYVTGADTLPVSILNPSSAASSVFVKNLDSETVAVSIVSTKDLTTSIINTSDIKVSLDGEDIAVSILNTANIAGTIYNKSVTLEEDVAHSSGDKGIMSLAVRNDTLATLADTDGDYTPLQVDADGGMYCSTKSLQDSNNTTTTPLGIGATFTGTGTETLNYSSITVVCFADEDSAASGLVLQWSVDNVNWTDHTAEYTYEASTDFSIGASVRAKYFRVVYTNGGSGQGAFRLYTFMHPTQADTNIRPLSYGITDNDSGPMVRSILAAKKPNNDYVNIDATAGGNLKISIQEISDGLDIGAGNAGSETARVSISTDDVNLSAINTATTAIEGTLATSIVNILPLNVAGSTFVTNIATTVTEVNSGTISSNINDIKDALETTIDVRVVNVAASVQTNDVNVSLDSEGVSTSIVASIDLPVSIVNTGLIAVASSVINTASVTSSIINTSLIDVASSIINTANIVGSVFVTNIAATLDFYTANPTADGQILAAAGADTYYYFKSITIINNDDVDGTISVGENGNRDNILETMHLPAYGGQVQFQFAGAGRKQPTVNTAIELELINAANNYFIDIEYYTGA